MTKYSRCDDLLISQENVHLDDLLLPGANISSEYFMKYDFNKDDNKLITTTNNS